METKKPYIRPEILVEEWKVYREANVGKRNYNLYEVSNLGRVKINGGITEPYYSPPNGYKRISGFYVHRAVAELFVPNPDNKPCVDHIDANKHNNKADNLRWVNHKENNNNPLTRQHMSESRKKLWKTPEYRQKQSESLKVAQNRPKTKQKRSESLKGKNKGKPSPIRGKHRVYNDPNDYTSGYHYEINI